MCTFYFYILYKHTTYISTIFLMDRSKICLVEGIELCYQKDQPFCQHHLQCLSGYFSFLLLPSATTVGGRPLGMVLVVRHINFWVFACISLANSFLLWLLWPQFATASL